MSMKITANAAKHLSENLRGAPESYSKDSCFRMVRTSDAGELRLTMSSPKLDDEKFEVAGSVILTLAPDIATHCEKKTLDVREQPDGTAKLVLS